MEERKRHYDKARVYASGELVEVKYVLGYMDHHYETEDGRCFSAHELDFMCEPDYWTRLEHQAAIGAMQAYIIASHISQFSFCEGDMKDCKSMAHALVEKLKEKEER